MDDLIDRKAFLERMMKTSRYFIVKFDIEQEPAVDAARVVRCKDCKYGEKCSHPNRIRCELTGRKNHVLDFCSHGERGDENAAD